MKSLALAAALAAPFALAAPAHAGEVYGGVYAHAVDTPFTLDSGEHGVDLQAGYRLDPIASVNTRGDTNFAGVGVSRKFDLGAVYLRPGVGLVVHDAPSLRVSPASGLRTDLGSRVLFEPELGVGIELAPRVSLEASWVHISNARLFNSRQNPGIDTIGVRANFRL
jgi:hypothetical protein